MSEPIEKVIIDKQIYLTLKKTSDFHKANCMKTKNDNIYSDAIEKKGAGATQPIEPNCHGDSINHNTESQNFVPPDPLMPHSSRESDQRAGKIIEPDISVEGPIFVDVAKVAKVETDRLSDEEILKTIRKKSLVKAKRLLEKIKEFPLKINWDSTGLARINGHYMNNCQIQDLIGLCFYPIRHKKIECLSLWYSVLKEANLAIHITNWELKQSELKDGWYFLGSLAPI